MGKKAVFCIARDVVQAARIVEELKTAGFSNNDISVLFPDKGTSRDFAHEHSTKAPEGETAGGVTGGVVMLVPRGGDACLAAAASWPVGQGGSQELEEAAKAAYEKELAHANDHTLPLPKPVSGVPSAL